MPDPVPSHVAGYRQWQQLGRQVSKGQPGYQILAPVTGRFASATPHDDESWRSLGKGEKPRAGETVRTKIVGVRPPYVWDASQTTGDPIPNDRRRGCWRGRLLPGCGRVSLRKSPRPASS